MLLGCFSIVVWSLHAGEVQLVVAKGPVGPRPSPASGSFAITKAFSTYMPRVLIIAVQSILLASSGPLLSTGAALP